MKKVFVLLLLISAGLCNAQDKVISKKTVKKTGTGGINHPKIVKTQGSNEYAAIRCGLQDKAGNMWFGATGEGAYRYNGKSFTHFTEKDGLSSNIVNSILEDKEGNIWFANDDGVCRYDGKKFINVPIYRHNSSIFSLDLSANNTAQTANTPTSMLQDKSGKIWLGTSEGVYCYNGKYFSPFLNNNNVINKNNLSLKWAQSMLQDSKGNIWFTTWFEGVCRYDGKSLTNYKPNGEVWFGGILEDKDGNIWLGRRSYGVTVLPKGMGTKFTNVLQGGIFDTCGISGMAQDKKGDIWFCSEADDMTRRETTGGVWQYDGKQFKNFTTEDGLSNDAVFCVTKDKSGGLWFGTRNTGLCRYDGKTFTKFSD